MKPFARLAIASCIVTMLLAGCGGEPAPAAQAMATASASKASALTVTAATYHPLIQRVYLAYFGRPADPAGLAFYAQKYLEAGAPTDAAAILGAYNDSAGVRALVDSFGLSQESRDLYPGDNKVFVAAIYRNLFNRTPDASGEAFWVAALDAGAITRGSAAISLMAGAQGDDRRMVDLKLAAASDFTAALNTPSRIAAYDGLAANAVVRQMLADVTLATDPAAIAQKIEATIATLSAETSQAVHAEVMAIIKSRCVGCHSVTPTFPGFSQAPLGIRYDTSNQVRADAARIHTNVVKTQFMPYGNFTSMTEAERAVIDRWFKMGAP